MNSTTELTETILRGQQKAAERQRQEKLNTEARQQEKAAKYQSRIRASGLPEWMLEYLSVDFSSGQEEWWYTLALPGCAPIVFTTFKHTQRLYHYTNVGVRVINEIRYERDAEKWYINYTYTPLPRMEDLDEAIALAANEGESWHIMQTEVDRRNAERLRPEQQPTTNTEPENKPPEIKLDELFASAYNATRNDDSNNGIIFALLAVATEIKYLRLTLEIQRDDEATKA